MPIYEYVCKQCGSGFEKLVMGESTVVACPACESKDLTKKFSAFGMSVAGSAPSPSAKPSGHVHSGGCGCGNPNPCGRFPTN